MRGFKKFCNLPFIYSAINVTQIHIQKPQGGFVGDYFSFKSKDYNMELQAMVDCQKKFHDVFVGLYGSMQNVHILHLLKLYKKAMNGDIFHLNKGEEKIKPYLITNKCDLLLPWLMIPHKKI
jgi:hypothetical protein